MNYKTGQKIKLGDHIHLGAGDYGQIVCIFETQEYLPEFPEAEWGYLKNGVLIYSEQIGLIHVEHPHQTQLDFIKRANEEQ